jgi:hypothetical protein
MSTKTVAVTSDHVFIARFAAKLLETRMVERSNSVRGRFFNILHEAVAVHRSSIREVSFVSECLSSTSPFDADERNFRGCVRGIVSTLGRSPATVIGEIAATIRRLLAEAGYSDIMEATLKALKRQDDDIAKRDADKRLLVLIKGALAEKDTQDFLDSLSPKSEERERAGMVNKAIDEAVAELREKFGVPAAQ